MSQQANIIAFDGAGTPVTHTLTAIGVSKDPVAGLLADYRELISTVPNGAQPTVRMTRRLLKSGVERISIDLRVPVMESISGANSSGYTAAPKIAFVDQHSYVGYFSERSTTTQRRLGRQWLINVLGGITTSVTPVNTGNAAELIDSAVFPN